MHLLFQIDNHFLVGSREALMVLWLAILPRKRRLADLLLS